MRDGDTTEITLEITEKSGTAAGVSIVPDTHGRTVYPTGNYRNMGARVPARTPAAEKPAARSYDVPDSLITKVEIHPWPQRYNYYQRFCDDAERFFSLTGTECPAEGYFSYIPQYAQLHHAQLKYYLWFRENARAGVYLTDVDLPYILLYIYEIINLPHKIAPEEGARQLAGLWLAYRRRRPELDRYLPEWMCDYCLIRKVPLPKELYPIVPEILPRATLKEFYVSAVSGSGLTPEALILLASDYSYRSSKYYADHKEAFDTHIPAAAAHAAAVCGIVPDPASMRKVKVERDAFCGSLCAQTVKRRIVVEYYSFTRSYELRSAVTAAVKLSENFVRKSEKIRSRLNLNTPDPAVSAAVSAYFDAEMPAVRQKRPAEDTSYEKLYDAPTEGIDFTAARGLEEASWETAEELTKEPAEEEIPAAPEPPVVIPEPEPDSAPAEEAAGVPFPDAIRAVLRGESFAKWCTAQPGRLSPDEAAGQINDYAADTMGDVVLELSGTDYILIDDYKEEVRTWLTAE